MKIYRIYIVIISLIVLFLTTDNANSCPLGYSEDNVSVTYNDCTINVKFCYLCAAIGVGFDIKIVEYDIPNNCLDSVLYYRYKFDSVAHQNILKRLMQVSGCLKPCSDPGWQIHVAEISSVECKKLVNDVPNAMFHLISCESTAVCHKMYKVCVTFNENGEAILNYLFDNSFIEPGADCPWLEIPPIPNEIPDGWTSDCFVWGTCSF